MNEETSARLRQLEEGRQELRERLHELADKIHELGLKVQVLWAERQRGRQGKN